MHLLLPDGVGTVKLVCLVLPSQQLDLVSQLPNTIQDGVPVHPARILVTGFCVAVI